jgi:cell wall-associated NlpC family hydrolase
MSLSPRIYGDLIGAAYCENGQGHRTFDCWGLVREVMRRAGVEVPDWPRPDESSQNQAAIIEAIAAGWERLNAPESACGVLFRTPHGPHIGVVVGRDRFMHIQAGTRACIERLSDPLWRDRRVGFYRWRGHAGAH